MDLIDLNRRAWDSIGKKVASPYMKYPTFSKMFDQFCKRLPPNARVLDLGCGPGVPVTKKLVDSGFSVVALDLSETMISLVEKNVPTAKTLRMSMTEISFQDEFDGIVSSYSLLCLDPVRFKEVLLKISKALKSNGSLFLALNEPTGPVPENYDNIEEIMGQTMYTRGYTEKEIRDMLTDTGLSITKVARETVTSKEYGTEHSLILLIQN